MQCARVRALDMTICNKCGKKSEFALRKLDAYCKECFLAAFVRKVRMDIGRHRIIQQKEKVQSNSFRLLFFPKRSCPLIWPANSLPGAGAFRLLFRLLGQILLAYSGGNRSSCLLAFVREVCACCIPH